MILVDTSIWVEHLRAGNKTLARLLDDQQALIHPFIIGEIALGYIRQRELVLNALLEITQAAVASHEEALHFINEKKLFGTGIGYVDAHLLASARLVPGTTLWTHDKNLFDAASRMALAATVPL